MLGDISASCHLLISLTTVGALHLLGHTDTHLTPLCSSDTNAASFLRLPPTAAVTNTAKLKKKKVFPPPT